MELQVKVNYQSQGLLYPRLWRDLHCLVLALDMWCAVPGHGSRKQLSEVLVHGLQVQHLQLPPPEVVLLAKHQINPILGHLQ
jgi:hypothetical protein